LEHKTVTNIVSYADSFAEMNMQSVHSCLLRMQTTQLTEDFFDDKKIVQMSSWLTG